MDAVWSAACSRSKPPRPAEARWSRSNIMTFHRADWSKKEWHAKDKVRFGLTAEVAGRLVVTAARARADLPAPKSRPNSKLNSSRRRSHRCAIAASRLRNCSRGIAAPTGTTTDAASPICGFPAQSPLKPQQPVEQRGILPQRRRRAGVAHRALLEHIDPVGQRQRERHALFRKQDGQPLRLQLADLFPQQIDHQWRQPLGGFIEQQ